MTGQLQQCDAYLIDLSKCLHFQCTGLGSWMAAVQLVIELVASDGDFLCIDDNDITSHIHGRAVSWLILASASKTLCFNG